MQIARNVEIELYGEQSGRGVGGRMGRGNQGWVSNNPDRTGIGSGYSPNKMGIGVGPSVRAQSKGFSNESVAQGGARAAGSTIQRANSDRSSP